MTNRIENYLSIKDNLKGIRKQVFDSLINDNTILGLSKTLGIPEKTVSGRISELESMGLIYLTGTHSGRSVFRQAPTFMIQNLRIKWIDRRIREMESTLSKYKKMKSETEKIEQLKLF